MSEVKVNKISPRTACGTVTLGDSGDTFTLPSGVTMTVASGATITNSGTASGFGATGEISWDTTVKTTGTFTATAGIGYFLNTTGGIITVNLPAGAAGDSVAMVDYAGTWDTNNVTVAANGSEKIGGVAQDATLSTERQSVTFVYIDGTQGWVNVLDSTSAVTGNPYIVATGGTPTQCGDYEIRTFTGPGTFCVSGAAVCAANNVVSYMVVAGGGSGGIYYGGGAGAGGFREYKNSCDPYTASPLDGNPGGTAITVSATPYAITVGGGGAGRDSGCPGNGAKGNDSIFSTITSTGGGYGSGGNPGACTPGGPGGSGGGGGGNAANTGGTGDTPPTTPDQGFPGGDSGSGASSSGGGATVAGLNTNSGAGGAGAGTGINPSPSVGTPGPSAPLRYFAGGGGAAGAPTVGGVGGGGGNPTPDVTVNTGGAGAGNTIQSGAPGIVILRYKFQ